MHTATESADTSAPSTKRRTPREATRAPTAPKAPSASGDQRPRRRSRALGRLLVDLRGLACAEDNEEIAMALLNVQNHPPGTEPHLAWLCHALSVLLSMALDIPVSAGLGEMPTAPVTELLAGWVQHLLRLASRLAAEIERQAARPTEAA